MRKVVQFMFALASAVGADVLFAEELQVQSDAQPSTINRPIDHDSTSQQTVSVTYSRLMAKLKASNPKVVVHLGWFGANYGAAQNINIIGLIGDHFSVNSHSSQNGLFGLGYFVDGPDVKRFKMSYGVDGYYLANSHVRGIVTQEQLFTNLAYSYSVTNYPIYAAARGLLNTGSDKYDVVFDLGMGPNIFRAGGFKETSLDGGVTLPDHPFSAKTNVAFSATAGVGVKVHNIFGTQPLECGYRFFYLGQGHFNETTSQLLNTLNTGYGYANALVCSLVV